MDDMNEDQEIDQLRERLVRIETKIDLYIINGLQDHETRLRILERWRYTIPASIFAAVASAVTSIYIALGR